jgi:cytochrome c55X
MSAAALPHVQADISAPRQAELKHLLTQDCGSCHGLTLKGGLGPALTPEAIAARPIDVLRDVILDGIPGTPMPPWRGMVTAEEAEWLAHALRRGDYASR